MRAIDCHAVRRFGFKSLAIVLLVLDITSALSAQQTTSRHSVISPREMLTGPTAFVDVNVVPMDTEQVLPHQTVLIDGGQITAMGPSSKVTIPAGAVRIDGRGKYLIPGLADMHVHLHPAFYQPSHLGDSPDWQAAADTVLTDHWLFLFLANGVTTIRNMDYMVDGGRSLRLRAQVGRSLVPRIYTAGAWAGRNSDGSSTQLGEVLPESVATYLAAYQAASYDFIKIRNEKSPKLLDSVAAAARRLGLPIAGHLLLHPVERALDAKIHASIEHLDGYHPLKPPIRESRVAKIPELAAATKRSGIWNMPHMTLFEIRAGEVSPLAWPELRYVSARQYRQKAERTAQMDGSQVNDTTDAVLHVRRQVVKALQDSGAGLLLGTDTPILPLLPGFAVHHELEALVHAGLTPYQALAMATKNVGTFFRAQSAKVLGKTGTVALGQRADLVLLNANPLKDIRYTTQSSGVMLDGRWFSRDVIERRLAILPYWKFSGPDVEEMSLLRHNITLTAAQEETMAPFLDRHREQWRVLIDSLRSGARDQAVDLEPAGSERLLQLAAQQFGEYRTSVLLPEQRGAFDQQARSWLAAYQGQGYRVAVPGVLP